MAARRSLAISLLVGWGLVAGCGRTAVDSARGDGGSPAGEVEPKPEPVEPEPVEPEPEAADGCAGHEPGELWKSDCNTCSCNSRGQVVCSRMACNAARGASALQ